MAVSKVGLGWAAGERDYTTLAAWYSARKSTGVQETASCKGDLGTSFVSVAASDFTAGALIETADVEYNGANHAALALLRSQFSSSSTNNLIIKDIAIIHGNGTSACVVLQGTSIGRRLYTQQNANPGTNSATLMVSANGIAENCVAVNTISTSTKVARASGTGTIRNCVVLGGNRAVQSEWTTSTTSKCYAANSTTTDYYWDNGRPTANVTNASEDATGDVGYRNLDPTATFVDYANADYRIRTTSPLHAAGIGAFFEPAVTDQVVTAVPAEQRSKGQAGTVTQAMAPAASAAEFRARAAVPSVPTNRIVSAVSAVQNARGEVRTVLAAQTVSSVSAVQVPRSAVPSVQAALSTTPVPAVQLDTGTVATVTAQMSPMAVPAVQLDAGILAAVMANQVIAAIPTGQNSRGVVQEVIVEEAGSQAPIAVPARQVGRAVRPSVVAAQAPNSLPAVQMTYGVRDVVPVRQSVVGISAAQNSRGVVQSVDVETGGPQVVAVVPAVQMAYALVRPISVDQAPAAVAARQVSRGRADEYEPVVIDPTLISFTPLPSGFTLNTVQNSFQLQQLR